MKELRILFTGVGRRVELLQAFRQAALVLNKKLKLYGADMAGTAPALAYCDEARKVCGMRDPGYIDELLRISIEDRIDLIIPTIDTDLLVLAENRDRFKAAGIRVLISSADKIRICRDKNYTSQFFLDCALKAPLPVNRVEDYRGGYPAFIKPKDGSSSVNAYKVENEEKLHFYASQVPDYIIQPFVSGREFTIDIFCDFDGKPLSIVPRERLQIRAGEVIKTKICLDRKMIKEAERICESFLPCGPLTVQLIRDDVTGEDWFIEINPRYGGGAPLSMKAGARSAEAILKLLSGEKPECAQPIEDGAVYSRFDQSVCIRNGRTGIKGVIFDLDDTLYSEKEYVRSGYKAVSDYLGGGFEKILWKFFADGKPAIDELLKSLGREPEKETVLEIYRSHIPSIQPYDGVPEMITSLKKRGIKVGIITDGRPEGQRNKIQALGLDVDEVIITDELGGVQFRKPCDIAFRIMATRWRLNPADMVYVGDNPDKDLQAPQQLGMKCILFANSDGLYFRDRQDIQHDMITVKSIEELTKEWNECGR